jgi:hypothetical protein
MNVLVQRQEGERSYSDMFRRYRKRVLIAMSAKEISFPIKICDYHHALLVVVIIKKPPK